MPSCSLPRTFAAGALLAVCAAAQTSGPPSEPPSDPPASVPGDSLPSAAEDPLPALVAEALRNNPALKAARLEAAMHREESRGAAALMPPRVGVEFTRAPLASFPNPLEDQAGIDWFAEQAFPFPGKRAALRRPGERRAEAGAARARAMELALAREVKETYLDLYGRDARLRINAENQALVRRFIEVARKQYEVGMGNQADILRAHAELAALALAAVELREERETALGRLNSLLDRDPDRAFAPPERLLPVTGRMYPEMVPALARARHPDLAAAEAEIRAREAETVAAGRAAWPDLMLRGMYQDMREPPPHGGKAGDGWGVMLGLDLPFAFWSAPEYRAGYRVAGIRAEQARLERRDRENRLAAELRAALARIRAAAEGLEVARTALVPQADQALRSVQAAYDNGKSSFMDLMDAYRMAIEAREEELMAEVKVARSRADLEAAAGMDFDALAGAAGGGRP